MVSDLPVPVLVVEFAVFVRCELGSNLIKGRIVCLPVPIPVVITIRIVVVGILISRIVFLHLWLGCDVELTLLEEAGSLGDELLKVVLRGHGELIHRDHGIVSTLVVADNLHFLALFACLSFFEDLINEGWDILGGDIIDTKVPVSGRPSVISIAVGVQRRMGASVFLATGNRDPDIVPKVKELLRNLCFGRGGATEPLDCTVARPAEKQDGAELALAHFAVICLR